MKTLHWWLSKEICRAVLYVSAGFIGLFFFIDMVDELSRLQANQPYGVLQAFAVVFMAIPGRLYELLPITLLIGTVFVLTSLATTSQYTILRISGFGPWQALRFFLGVGLFFSVFTFCLGNYISPAFERWGQAFKSHYQGGAGAIKGSAWLKEKQQDKRYVVNVGAWVNYQRLKDIRIFEFNAQGLLSSITQAAYADVNPTDQPNTWHLEEVERTALPPVTGDDAKQAGLTNNPSKNPSGVPALAQGEGLKRSFAKEAYWQNGISKQTLALALLEPDRMPALDLWRYIGHLKDNQQAVQRYEIAFWKQVVYPLSCLVMLVMAMPFAYLHFRSQSLTTHVFGAVMLGVSFFVFNTLCIYAGELQNWPPWLAASATSMVYTAFSLAAFRRLVIRS